MTTSRKIRRVYLDYAAATPVDPRVAKVMEPFLAGSFANPSAIHKEGVAARKAVDESRKNIATLLGVHGDEIVFTGSATESCNFALFGAVLAWQKTHPGRVAHIIVSAIEHDAVLEPARKLEVLSVRVTRLPVDSRGIVLMESLKSAITSDTVVISVMYANNEIGVIQPIGEIAKIIRKWKKEMRGVNRIGKPQGDEYYPLFHTDATQAANYCDMHIPRLGVDMLTMNAAKIYGPKGVGLLAVLRGVPIAPMTVGGGHEGGRRAGTENVPGIVGFAEAFRVAREILKKESNRLTVLRDYVVRELKKLPLIQDPALRILNTRSGLEEVFLKARPCINGVRGRPLPPSLLINGDEVERLPNNVNFSLLGIDHEFLALQLDAKGFSVATKSACNEADTETSHVLVALRKADLPAQAGGTTLPQSGIRLSFGRGTIKKDVVAFFATLRKILQNTKQDPRSGLGE